MKRILLAIMACCLLILTACGPQQENNKAANNTFQFKGESITLPAKPQRIIPLSASLLNMLYAVDGTAIARPTTDSLIPDAAKSLPTIGHVSHINAETLVSLKPDLILGLKSQNQKIASILESNKVPHILISYDGIDDNVPLLQFLGKLTGNEKKAAEVIQKYETDVKNICDFAKRQSPLRVVILRATGKDVTAETPIAVTASMVEQLGMHNIIKDHPNANMKVKTVPFSLEVLTTDNPDVIFIVTMGKAEQITARMQQEMTGNPAWNGLKAVRNGRVYYLPSELFLLNPGIRTPEAMKMLVNLAYPNAK